MTRGRLTNHNTRINFKEPINPGNEVGIRHSKRGNFVKTRASAISFRFIFDWL